MDMDESMDLPDSSCPDLPEDFQENDIQENRNIDVEESEVSVTVDEEIFLRHINDCLVPKLARNYDERENHAELFTRNETLRGKMKFVLDEVDKYDFQASSGSDMQSDIISCLVILHRELLSTGPWNTERSKEYAKKLGDRFHMNCMVKMDDILKKNDICDGQALYDKTLDKLCKKLTSDDIKKYPAQVEVYCDLVQNYEKFDVKVKPLRVLPVALILMDDYIEANKIKGLQCCHILLKNLTPKDFDDGNYYDVIYLSIKNALHHKDMRITELTLTCALELCRIFPADVKDNKLDEMYTAALEHLGTESNLYRKASFFKYTKKLMEMLEIKFMGKSVFKTIICDTVEHCMNDSVAAILLVPCLECLEVWINYCWPAWKLSADFKLLCALLKYYSKCNAGEGGLLAQKLIVTLVSLCTPEEQSHFTAQLRKNEGGQNVLANLKKDIGVNTDLK